MNNNFNIVMPNLNGAKYLERSIRSVMAQERLNVELYVVDSRSTDGSHQILAGLQSEFGPRLKWLQKEDTGISNAINIALNESSGRFIGYLGSDDLLLPAVLEKVEFALANTNADFVYTDSITYYAQTGQTQPHRCKSNPFNREVLLMHCTPVGLQNIFFKRDFLERYKFDESNRYSMDYELYFRFIDQPFKGLHLPIESTINVFDNNISTDSDGKQTREAILVAQKNLRDYKGPCWWIPPPPPPPFRTRLWRRLVREFKS